MARRNAKGHATIIVAAEPDDAQLLTSGIAESFGSDGAAVGSHPGFRPHLMQGWSPDFISQLAQQVLDADNIDAFQPVAGVAALPCARDLAARESIFCGVSGGSTFAAALEVARTAPKGSRILAMLDTGDRYLPTPLFADISEDMSEDEMEVSRSTPNYRFDVPTPAPPAVAAPAVDLETLREVEQIIAGKPVVIFALEWREFTWSVRNMFAEAGIVIGTDGRRSTVARKTGAAAIGTARHSCGCVNAHVDDLQDDGYRRYYGADATAGTIPTNDARIACLPQSLKPISGITGAGARNWPRRGLALDRSSSEAIRGISGRAKVPAGSGSAMPATSRTRTRHTASPTHSAMPRSCRTPSCKAARRLSPGINASATRCRSISSGSPTRSRPSTGPSSVCKPCTAR